MRSSSHQRLHRRVSQKTGTASTAITCGAGARGERARGREGISLFVVPQFLVDEDGSLGARNDVHCASIEHKLGINASPPPCCICEYADAAASIPRGARHYVDPFRPSWSAGTPPTSRSAA